MTNEKIEELLKIANEYSIAPRKFEHTEDGLVLNLNDEFDRKWYEDDETFGI